MLNPVDLLSGSLRLARRGVDHLGSLPGDEFVLDELRELNEVMRSAGFHALFLGEPVYSSGISVEGRPGRLNIGQAPTPPLGFAGAGGFLRGGSYRMGPTRSKGMEMARKYKLREARGVQETQRPAGPMRATEQGIRHFLPEVSPPQDAWRRFQMRQRELELGPVPKRPYSPGRAGARTAEMDQRMMDVEEFEDLFPEDLVAELSRTMDPISFQSLLDTVTSAGPRARSFGLPEAAMDARIKADMAIEEAEDIAKMSGRFRDAAKLAAARISYHRTPREMMNYRFGTYRTRDLGGRLTPERWKTEGRAWMEDRDAYLKMRFRERMREYREREHYYR